MPSPRAMTCLALLASAGCVAPAAVDPSAAAPEILPALAWEERAAAPLVLAETAVAAEGPVVTVVGGWTEAGGGSPFAVRYHAGDDAWERLPAYPLPVHHAQAATLDGTVYVFGGAATALPLPGRLLGVGPRGWPITPLAFRLDEGAQAWEPIAPLPVARGLGGAAVVDGKVYLVGGVTLGGEYLEVVHVYDPATDTYAQLAPLPTPRDHLSVVALEGRIHAVAGRSNANGSWDDLETHEALDLAAGTWSRLADAPLGRGGQGAAVLGDGRFALVGGERLEGDFTVYDAAHAYDAAADAWSPLPPLPVGRHGHVAAGWGGALYVAGGALLEGRIETSTLVLR